MTQLTTIQNFDLGTMRRRSLALGAATASCGVAAVYANSRPPELASAPSSKMRPRSMSAIYPTNVSVRKVLTSVVHNIHVDQWWVDANSCGLASHVPWSVTKRTLHGGRQEGVDVIEVNNGNLEVCFRGSVARR